LEATLKNFDYQIVTLFDGAIALALYAEQRTKIAAVQADLIMPVMDRTAMIRALKHMNPKVKILVATGGGTVNRSSLRELGVTHFISKTYTSERILRELQEVLAGEAAALKTQPRLSST